MTVAVFDSNSILATGDHTTSLLYSRGVAACKDYTAEPIII